MIKVTFIDLDKRKAFRKTLDFWYKNFSSARPLREFLLSCSWRKEGRNYIVTYCGPPVPQKEESWQ